MTRILLTAFDVYDRWRENSSWLALIDFTGWYEGDLEITTRRYPIDLDKMRQQLEDDLRQNFDYAIHLGQSPGSPVIKLESVGLNLRTNGKPLLVDGPVAYRSSLDLEACCEQLTGSGIPTQVSHHAGTYLCNAALYFSQHYSEMMGRRTQSIFVHLPLAPQQVALEQSAMPSMSTPMQSTAISIIADRLSADD